MRVLGTLVSAVFIGLSVVGFWLCKEHRHNFHCWMTRSFPPSIAQLSWEFAIIGCGCIFLLALPSLLYCVFLANSVDQQQNSETSELG